MMRKGVVLAIALAAVTAASWAQSGREAKSETVLRWHFAGTKHLAGLKDLKTLSEVLALPETQALREAAAQGLAGRAAARYNKSGNTNANAEVARLMQPLLADLWQHESRFQLRAKGAQEANWMLAVKLPEDRAAEWNKALAELTKRTGMQGANPGEAKGWTAQREKYRLSISKAKDWTVVQGGTGVAEDKAAKDFMGSLEKRTGKRILEAEVNSPLLGELWSAPRLAHAPKLAVTAEPKKDGIYSELMVDYGEDLGIKPEKWSVPTDLIREPLISFTAIQGVEKRLAGNEWFRKLGAKQTPNQVFFWGQSTPPFAISMAADVKNPAEVVAGAADALKDVKLPTGALSLSTNRRSLVWMGPPIVRPFLEVAPEPHSSFIKAGLFPLQGYGPRNVPAPKELFEQLNKKNLVYYDWEVTGERLRQWIPIRQLGYIVTGRMVPNHSAPSEKWLLALRARVGNTVTQGTLENARRVKVVRQSLLGLNALELLALAHWADSGDLIQTSTARTPKSVPAPAPALP